jgi:hypothetical protein
MEKLFLAAKVEFVDGGLGVYPDSNFIHVDVRGTKARWGRIKGEYVGWEQALPVWIEFIGRGER